MDDLVMDNFNRLLQRIQEYKDAKCIGAYLDSLLSFDIEPTQEEIENLKPLIEMVLDESNDYK
jgi:hypothetical protein